MKMITRILAQSEAKAWGTSGCRSTINRYCFSSSWSNDMKVSDVSSSYFGSFQGATCWGLSSFCSRSVQLSWS